MRGEGKRLCIIICKVYLIAAISVDYCMAIGSPLLVLYDMIMYMPYVIP